MSLLAPIKDGEEEKKNQSASHLLSDNGNDGTDPKPEGQPADPDPKTPEA
ncbi:MAG TPA: hypothetical protein VHB72_01745 [Candidatus Saccharimonadales bacterium]|jgi:hypothetical protein|nr:hypothetical protein [Candidatus Saccharimonadales bacterium]